MITVESFSNIHDLQYADSTGLRVNLLADIEGLGLNIPFTASTDDIEEYGRLIYTNALAEMYGAVSPAPSPPESEIAYQARCARNSFVRASDPLTITDYSINDEYLTTAQREELFAVRMSFKRWPAQPGWPHIALPTVPQWINDELNARGYTLPQWP